MYSQHVVMLMVTMVFAACARAFYIAGCKLVLCARRLQELQRVKMELERLSVVRNTIHFFCVISCVTFVASL